MLSLLLLLSLSLSLLLSLSGALLPNTEAGVVAGRVERRAREGRLFTSAGRSGALFPRVAASGGSAAVLPVSSSSTKAGKADSSLGKLP